MTRIIDIFNHYLPPAFYEKIIELGGNAHMMTRASKMPAMSDINYRLKLIERFEGYCQIPCIVSPNVEQLVSPKHTAELARFANEEFYKLCQKYPRKFPSFIAVLPLDDINKSIKEAEYAVNQLGAVGVQIFTNQQGSPIDSPEFFQLYKKLEELNTTLWIHPARNVKEPYYHKAEELSKYELWWTMLWPIETTMAASRLVYSGIYDSCPNLKIILHHAGGMIPMMEGRLENGLKLYSTRTSSDLQHLIHTPIKEKKHIDEFKKFYVDCATFGSQAAIECAINFYGIEHMVFASDMPFDPEDGSGYIERTLRDVNNLKITQEQKEAILYKNVERILNIK